MAFADLGSIASGGSSGNNQANLTIATTANCAGGELVVVAVTVDNITTGGGDTLETSGVVIGTAAPFALTKGRQNSTNLAAQAGASVSLWWGVLPYAIASGQNIVATFTNAGTSDATALSARHFSFASLANSVAVEATNATTGTTTNPTSLTATTANIACLRIRATGCEYDSTQTITTTSTWTTWAEGASAATGTITEAVIECEHLISTTTSAASAPTLGSACDSASVYVAFKEVANPVRLPILDVPWGPLRGREYWIDAVGFVEAAAAPEILSAGGGAYALTGSDAALTVYTPPDTTNLPAGAVNWFNPWGPRRPVQDWFKGPIPAVPVTLTAGSGSYALTGTAATSAFGQVAGSGSYSITGSAAPLAYRLTSQYLVGGYELTGSPAGFAIGIAAAAGSYTSTGGSAVTFAFGQVGAAGSYTLTGADAGLVIPGAVTYMPAGMSGGYVPWGRRFPINLRTSTGRPLAPAPTGVTAAGGSYVITGAAVSFVVATPPDTTNLPAGATNWFNPWRRAYPVALLSSRTDRPAAAAPVTLTAAAGSYVLTGADAQLTVSGNQVLAAAAGSYTITGSSATLALGLSANSGTYTVSGTAAVLARGYAAGAGAYAIIGTDAQFALVGNITFACGAGSYTLTGSSITISPPEQLAGTGGGGGRRYPRFRKKKDWRDELQDLLADLLPPEEGEPAKPIPSYDPRPLEPRLPPAARQVEDLLKYIKDDALPSPELVIGPELLGRDALLSTTAALASLSRISLPQIIPEFDEDDDEEAVALLLAVLFE